MKKNTRWTVAKIVGASFVGIGAGVIVRKGLGATAGSSVVGGLATLLAHEMLNAPVSDWVYKQI